MFICLEGTEAVQIQEPLYSVRIWKNKDELRISRYNTYKMTLKQKLQKINIPTHTRFTTQTNISVEIKFWKFHCNLLYALHILSKGEFLDNVVFEI